MWFLHNPAFTLVTFKEYSPGVEFIKLKRGLFGFLRSWFSGLLLKHFVNLSGIELVHRMTPEAKTGELFDGELRVEAVLDPERWKHEVQHGCALLSVHCHSLLQTEKVPHLRRPIRQQYLRP